MLQHRVVPLFHAALSFLDETTILVVRQHRQEFAQRPSAVTDQPDFYREAQADALGIEIDLDTADALTERIELEIRKGGAHH